jgi:uncharacterized protein (DUF488 family)
MRVCTIGFSGKSAKAFFTRLQEAGVEKLIDIRRSNNTLYSGFTRLRDLPFLLEHLCHISYVHEPEFAPSLDLLRSYQARLKKNKHDAEAWKEFSERFRVEIEERPILELFRRHGNGASAVCLLCTEHLPDHCHRRLLAERLKELIGDGVTIEHL